MKNILLIGLASLVLFGVSAGLSVWLQTNAAKTADTAHADDKKKKGAADDHGSGHGDAKDKDHADPHKADGKEKPGEGKPSVVPTRDADRVEYRRLQMEVVAADMSGQMQDYDKLLKRVAVEMKVMAAQQTEIDTKLDQIQQAEDRSAKAAADGKKAQADAAATEQSNLARIAGMFDQMAPEAAAALLQQWADSGQTDTAVRVLALMKPTKSPKVLTAFTDPTVPPLLMDRMKALKLTPPPGTP